MAVHIRLSRTGAKKSPFYRIVVADQRCPRDGRFLENLGTFDPSREASFRINQERLVYWRSVGAKATPTVEQIIKRYVPKASVSG